MLTQAQICVLDNVHHPTTLILQQKDVFKYAQSLSSFLDNLSDVRVHHYVQKQHIRISQHKLV